MTITKVTSLSYGCSGQYLFFTVSATLFHQVASVLLYIAVLQVDLFKWKNNISFFPSQNKETYEPLCKVPLMTSSKEEQKLIATSNKVVYVVFHIMCWITVVQHQEKFVIIFLLKYKFLCLHSLLSNCCITEATTNIHIPGEFSSTDIRH